MPVLQWPAGTTRRLVNTALVLLAGVMLAACNREPMSWEQIIASGKLRFATIENPSTYYPTPAGAAGFEYELARRFADEIGVELEVVVADTAYDAINMVQYHKAAIAGAGLTRIDLPAPLQFGPTYYSVPQQLVYRQGDGRPAVVTDSPNRQDSPQTAIDVTALQYEALKEDFPFLSVQQESNIASLLEQIQADTLDSTITSARMVESFRYLFPDLQVARDLTAPQPVAWVFRSLDGSLYAALQAFFQRLQDTGELALLLEQHFGHIASFDYVDISTFQRRLQSRLPELQPLFMQVAAKYGLDWTLLAAMSYQESHWDSEARSPTGVRGLMMLTENTAGHLGIADRLDPLQSIEGGARYYLEMLAKIPERIPFPDRKWFALAAYNIGFLHLENARVITQGAGGDPDRWQDVRNTLIAISEEDQYLHLQSGQIRWREPVRYVHYIRKYQDALRWRLMQQQVAERRSATPKLPVIIAPAL